VAYFGGDVMLLDREAVRSSLDEARPERAERLISAPWMARGTSAVLQSGASPLKRTGKRGTKCHERNRRTKAR
jgi:hypothetical protein